MCLDNRYVLYQCQLDGITQLNLAYIEATGITEWLIPMLIRQNTLRGLNYDNICWQRKDDLAAK